MKNFAALLGVYACTTALVAIAPAVLPTAATAAEGKIKIAVAMNRQAERRWAVDRAAMEAEAARQGAVLVFQYADSNPTTQAAQVENLLSQEPNVLVIVPADREAAGALVQKAHQAGVPVVGYDGGITTAKLDYYVTRNNAAVGTLQAQAAMRVAGKGNYALIKGDPGNDVAQTIAKSYEAEFKDKADVKIVFDQFIVGWSPATAQSNAENVLSANADDIAAFVVTNDGMATGVAQAIKSRNLAGKVFLSGLDGETPNLKLIADGVQTMTAYTDLVDHGTATIKAAVAIAKGEKPEYSEMVDLGAGEVPTHLVPVIEINKENLCGFVTKGAPEGWTSVEEVFGSADACK
jgi:D-xylose transport system substrate-binding protein